MWAARCGDETVVRVQEKERGAREASEPCDEEDNRPASGSLRRLALRARIILDASPRARPHAH